METYVETSTNKWLMKEGHLLDTEITRKKFNFILKTTKAKSIFEIGFNGGHSARLWLDLKKDDPDFRLHSVDICNHEYTEEIARELEKQDTRFTFTKIDSNDLNGEDLSDYDLLFIDGDHSEDGVRNDMLLGAEAKMPYMLIDDYNLNATRTDVRIASTVNSIVGDVNFKYAFHGKWLHYDCTGGTNAMRMITSYEYFKFFKDQSIFKKQ
jgi:hypothetical protein